MSELTLLALEVSGLAPIADTYFGLNEDMLCFVVKKIKVFWVRTFKTKKYRNMLWKLPMHSPNFWLPIEFKRMPVFLEKWYENWNWNPSCRNSCAYWRFRLVEAERFLVAVSRERFDYTEWQRHGLPELPLDEIARLANLETEKMRTDPDYRIFWNKWVFSLRNFWGRVTIQ